VSTPAQLVARAGRRHDALVAGVLDDGEATFHARRSDEKTLFEAGSVTKSFTGVLLADMCLRGEIALTDPVTMYLPDSELPRWRERPPTLEELATHRAALPNAPTGLGRKETAFALGLRWADPWAGIDPDASRAAVRSTAARRPPGGRFSYSSLGFALLGDALAARAGSGYEDLLCERICAPLGLLDTDLKVPPEKQPRLLAGRSRRGRPRPPLRDQMPAAGAIRTTPVAPAGSGCSLGRRRQNKPNQAFSSHHCSCNRFSCICATASVPSERLRLVERPLQGMSGGGGAAPGPRKAVVLHRAVGSTGPWALPRAAHWRGILAARCSRVQVIASDAKRGGPPGGGPPRGAGPATAGDR
jgi:CubicO group peptidase (beta-lactamase class C family)